MGTHAVIFGVGLWCIRCKPLTCCFGLVNGIVRVSLSRSTAVLWRVHGNLVVKIRRKKRHKKHVLLHGACACGDSLVDCKGSNAYTGAVVQPYVVLFL